EPENGYDAEDVDEPADDAAQEMAHDEATDWPEGDEPDAEDVDDPTADEADGKDDADGADVADEALEELETEELEMLTDDEASETLVVDEVRELQAIRRAELSLDEDGGERSADEFQCQSCFLVLKKSQLADRRRKLCIDCAE
ncbi:MAG: DUF4193 family protein, partial [Acidimicrobiia bacterium]